MAKEFGKAVIIGLGGTGQKALIRIKKMLLDNCGTIPPCIRLLAFDTSSNRDDFVTPDGTTVSFTDEEFCHLNYGQIGECRKNEFVSEWWIPYPAIDPLAGGEGAGGIREIGRLSLWMNVDRVMHRLREAYDSISAFGLDADMKKQGMELLDITPQVYVVGSFAGGTGSGAFFDFSILCRSLGEMRMFYNAYFVLPWIYRNVAKTAYENGYAALLELEHLNKCNADNPYTVQFGRDLEVTLAEKPYHIVNLVDGRCRNNYRVQNPRDLAYFVGECIYNAVGAIGEQAADVTSNIMTIITNSSPADWDGMDAGYSTFGTSAIVYPHDEMLESASLKFAYELADAISKGGGDNSGDLPYDAVIERTQMLVNKENLSPELSGLLGSLLAPDALGHFTPEDEINYRSRELRLQAKAAADLWASRRREDCELQLQSKGDELQATISGKIQKELQQIQQEEDNGDMPPRSAAAANAMLLTFCTDAQKDLAEQKAANARRVEQLREDAERYYEGIPEKPARFPFSTAPARTACANYFAAREKLLEAELMGLRMQRAIELFGAWADEARVRDQAAKSDAKAQAGAAPVLQDVMNSIATKRAALTTTKIRKLASPFEVHIGAEDTIYYKENQQLPTATDDVGRFFEESDLDDAAAISGKNSDEVCDQILDFARKRMAPLADVSVLEVLEKLEKEDPGYMERTVAEAVQKASLLLPLNETQLAAKQRVLQDFTVIGGYDRETLSQTLGQFVNTADGPQNLWASTGDRSRISFCTFFAAIPVHALVDVDTARNAYLERVYPPAHTDKQFEFELDDILPQNRAEVYALRLLALATLDATGLIKRVELRNGNKFYRLDPKVLGKEGDYIDDEDLQLPGKPGKFYSLYAELSKDDALQEKLEQALLAMEKDESKMAEIRSEMEQKYEEYRAILDQKEFNKTITGNLYRQEVAFYRRILQQKLGLDQALSAKS